MSAFAECDNLKVVKIGKGLKNLSVSVFKNSPLDTLYCMAENPPQAYNTTFTTLNSGMSVIVPCDSKSKYEEAQYWKKFKNYNEWCNDIDPLDIPFNDNLGTNDIATTNSISVYPNPAKDEVVIKAEGRITVFDSKGQVVKILNEKNITKILNTSNFESGIYYIKTDIGTQKLIVK